MNREQQVVRKRAAICVDVRVLVGLQSITVDPIRQQALNVHYGSGLGQFSEHVTQIVVVFYRIGLCSSCRTLDCAARGIVQFR